ncbi:nucleotidyltransferase domain-containing protein [Oerskovia sp. Sa1BUA8]|uniref:Nucleotidyltransferase domain-containing protein n=1 Tax=Oerskovia douganii TaxID=2762210 RepID=A0A9D5UCK0_9CELL|nr:nucleotidyltransferase domain-containing protein [Oerskovia douganii]MBE7702193.1 nucleotidyltransferase domain-containing protein [Oerskovia douganii]
MDWSSPVSTIVPGLEGPVLRALWARSDELTGGQVHRVARAGTAEGVRRALERLERQGVVERRSVGPAHYYRVNRDHLCWPAIEALFDALHPWRELRRRVDDLLHEVVRDDDLRRAIGVAVVGSAARGDGTAADDLDLLVVVPDDVPTWITHELADRLRRDARTWTGNEADVHLRTTAWLTTQRDRPGALDRWAHDAEQVLGPSVHDHLPLVVLPD